MTKRFGRKSSTLALVAALTITACDEDKAPLEPVTPVASVEVVGPLIEVPVGTEVQLSATPRAADGSALTGRPVTWSSSDRLVAKVSPTGWLTAYGAGAVTISATAEGKAGTVEIGIVPAAPVVTRVTVSPGAAVLEIGANMQYQATAYDANNQVITGLPVTWSSSDPARATVTATGLVTAVAAGHTDIRVETGGKSTGVGLTITEPEPQTPVGHVVVSPGELPAWVGTELQLIAQTYTQSGEELYGRAVIWSSENPELATVNATGKVIARAPGTARIRAASEGRVGYATIRVRSYPTGPVHEYQFDGTDQLRIPFLDIGPTLWTDPTTGVVQNAYRVITNGKLRLIFENNTMPRWEQELVIHTYTVGLPPEIPVARQTVSTAGILWYNLDGSYLLKNGSVELRTRQLQAGELAVSQRVFGGPELWLVWELR